MVDEVEGLKAQLASLTRGREALEEEWRFANSPAMRVVKATVDRVAPTDVTVLIWGESGVGKEIIPKLLHWKSSRRDEPLVKVNCAALPLELLESELFGYERGAFTGADRQKTGKFEFANKGTIFLDEIGELPWPLQAKLLGDPGLGAEHHDPLDGVLELAHVARPPVLKEVLQSLRPHARVPVTVLLPELPEEVID